MFLLLHLILSQIYTRFVFSDQCNSQLEPKEQSMPLNESHLSFGCVEAHWGWIDKSIGDIYKK